MRKILFALVCITLLSSPALADRFANTPSGQPEASFSETTLSDAGGKIVSSCMDSGFQVTSQTTNQITCEVPLNSWKSAVTQMLIGNSYSTTPRSYVSVSLAQIGPNVRTQARAWVETQTAFGQNRQHQYTDDATFNNLINFLMRAGADLPHGTTFSGTYLGFDYDAASAKTSALSVIQVTANAPAEKAGMKVGDRIIAVNGKRFKNSDDFTKKLRSVQVGATYPVLVQRDGQEVTLSLVQRTRPTVGSPEYTAMMADWRSKKAQAETSAVAPAPASKAIASTPPPAPANSQASAQTVQAPPE